MSCNGTNVEGEAMKQMLRAKPWSSHQIFVQQVYVFVWYSIELD